jgi:hypothetical protein
MRFIYPTVITAVFILASSCDNTINRHIISSGRIDYKITYLNNDLDNRTLELLPRRMKLLFNEKQALNNIEGFLGFYKLSAITNFHTRKCSTLLKVFEKQYLFKGKREEQMCCFDTMEDMKITETGETKTIAGFNCKKAIVHLPSSDVTFEIYYTDEIRLKHPNATNPYKNIRGVLMEFELNLLYLRMRFVAENFHAMKLEDLQNEISDDSRQVSRDQMTQILNKLME